MKTRATLHLGLLVASGLLCSCGDPAAEAANKAADMTLAEVEKNITERETKLGLLEKQVSGEVRDLGALAESVQVFRGIANADAMRKRLATVLDRPLGDTRQERAQRAVDTYDTFGQRIDVVLKQGREAFDRAAEAAVKRTSDLVNAKLAEAASRSLEQEWPDNPFEAAREIIKGFPVLFLTTSPGGTIDDLLGLVTKREIASKRARDVLARARRMREAGAHARAMGMLEAFGLLEQYQDTPEAAAVARMIEEVREEAEENKEREAAENELPWEDLFNSENTVLPVHWEQQYGTWEVEDGALIGTSEGTEGGFIRTGPDEWTDYVVVVEFSIQRAGFDLAIRGSVEEDQRRHYERIRLDESTFERASWHTVQVEVRGDRRSVLRLDTFDEIDSGNNQLEKERGGIGLIIHSNGEVKFRSIRVKILKQ